MTMRAWTPLAIALALVGMGAALEADDPQRPPRDVAAPPARSSTAAITGRVTGADTGTPLRRAEVAAVSDTGDSRRAVTDDQGRFELPALGAGRWNIVASKSGYLSQHFGQRRVSEPASPVRIAEGERFAADFALTRASAITGRVYDQFGDAVASVHVSVMRARMRQGRRHLQPVGLADLTDDTGAFRLHSLPPGEYYVAASLRVAPVDSVVQTTHAPTYYPGSTNVAEAQRVVLRPGAEVSLAFPLLAFRTARVSGIVLDATGAPASALLNLSSEAGELGIPLGIGGATRTDGTFTLPDVPPGVYTLNATLRGPEAADHAALPVTIYGDDVSGLTLVLAPPGMLRGTIVADTGVTRALPRTLDLVARSVRAGAEMTVAQSSPEGFDMPVPAGPFHLHVETPEGWTVKAIAIDNVDATDATIDLRGQRDVPAHIVLTDRVTEVTGTVAAGSAERPPTVVVFPEDAAKWSPPSRYVRAVRADARGAFRIAGLPPDARYLAAAVDYLEEGEGEDPEFLRAISAVAIGFALAEGERRVIDLGVIQR